MASYEIIIKVKLTNLTSIHSRDSHSIDEIKTKDRKSKVYQSNEHSIDPS